MHRRSWGFIRVVLLGVVLSGCGGADKAVPFASKGQVVAKNSVSPVGMYSASRFAEQATFGPTPELVNELRQKGFEGWIDQQFALPVSLVDTLPFSTFVDPAPDSEFRLFASLFPNLALAAPDQLRTRVAWSLSQFVVVSDRKVDLAGVVHWINLLQGVALGNYGDLLYRLSISPAMGVYLDNSQNRPKSAECPHCAPNENFARELLQLFTVGVFKLNPDGTPVRDANGRFIETYTQRDVEQLARVLTGWSINNEPPVRPTRNYGNWAKPMVPTTWPPERDSGAKTVLGNSFPAGQTQEKDLRDAIAMLMAHPNTAPFVALRMIQHMVKSNPSPAYVGRVAAKFRDNGKGVVGDMQAVVRAVLLDSEARAGDNPSSVLSNDGKFREPFLHNTGLWRGLGCKSVPSSYGHAALAWNQRPFNAESVFGFYAPTDRAPGSNLLAPEQKLANASEFGQRLNQSSGVLWDESAKENNLNSFTAAGCSVQPFVMAYALAPRPYLDLISERFFRGAMPPTLRSNIEQLIKQPQWDPRNPANGTFRMIDFALSTPYYGVMK